MNHRDKNLSELIYRRDPATRGTIEQFSRETPFCVLNQSKCKRRKYATDTQLPVEGGAEQQQQTSSCSLHQHPPSTSYTWTLDNSLVHQSCPTGLLVTSEIPVARRQNSCESGRDTPMSNATTHQSVCTVKSPPAHQRHQPSRHYYSDDREMPAWKVYAKEL